MFHFSSSNLLFKLFSKFIIHVICVTSILFPTLLYADNVSSSSAYLQLSSSKDQVATEDTLNHPITVILDNVDAMSGMDYNKEKNEIKILQSGVYFIMASFQCGARETTGNIIKGGDLRFWFDLNRDPLPNSGSWVFAAPNARSKLVVTQMLQSFSAGDILAIKYSSSAPGMGIISLPASEYWPASTGVSFTMYKISG